MSHQDTVGESGNMTHPPGEYRGYLAPNTSKRTYQSTQTKSNKKQKQTSIFKFMTRTNLVTATVAHTTQTTTTTNPNSTIQQQQQQPIQTQQHNNQQQMNHNQTSVTHVMKPGEMNSDLNQTTVIGFVSKI